MLLGHLLPRQGITGRFANGERGDAKLIDENTKAVFAETIGNPAGNICDNEAQDRESPRCAARPSCSSRSTTAPLRHALAAATGESCDR